MIPLYIIPTSFRALGAGALLLQAGSWGAWGVVCLFHHRHIGLKLKRTKVTIHLSELSPPEFRALFPGLVYQVGNVTPDYLFLSPVADPDTTNFNFETDGHECFSTDRSYRSN
jgi:SHS family lactate transporter-like MFS transporter